MIRVFIVNPTSSISSFMAQSLAQQNDMRVIYQVTSVNEAMARIGRDNCHVVLAGASLPDDGAMTLIRKLRNSTANVRVVVTGVTNNNESIMRYVLAGALGYTVVDDTMNHLVTTIRAAFANKAMISQEIAAMLMAHVAKLSTIATRSTPDSVAHTELTERESDVLHLMAEGCSNKVIADRLIIGIGTVKNHVHNVLKKLNLRSRKEAAMYMMHIKSNQPFARTRYSTQIM